jgi:hypothetical protein
VLTFTLLKQHFLMVIPVLLSMESPVCTFDDAEVYGNLAAVFYSLL